MTKKRIPKLRRLLRRLGACDRARSYFADMTLQKAWQTVNVEYFWPWRQWFIAHCSADFAECDYYPNWRKCPRHGKHGKLLLRLFGRLVNQAEFNGNKLPRGFVSRWGGYEDAK